MAVGRHVGLIDLRMQGRNRLWLSVMESRSFCVVVQLAQRRSMDEVRALMAPPETVQAALQRVMRQVMILRACELLSLHDLLEARR